METVKSTIIALFLVLVLTAPTLAQPVTVLLQEGLYA